MKNKNRILIIAALVAIILFSCPQEPGDTGTGNPHEPAAYVCTVTTTGAYYVNGTKRGDLDIPAGPYRDIIFCTVSGGKVYVGGRYYSGGSEKYAYWVDGVRTDLSIPAGYVNYMYLLAVSDGKVYVRGSYYDAGTTKDCYWVNGVRTDLDIPDGYSTNIYNNSSFTVLNSRVYASGSYSRYRNEGYSQIEESRKAAYWVDGVRTDLIDPAEAEDSEARNITVLDGKVYVVGSYGDLVDMGNSDYSNFRYIGKACYWIDGERTDLDIPIGTESSEANAITVSGGKVYVSGSYGNYEDYYTWGSSITYMGKACYWVDGVRTDLDIPAGTKRSNASNLIVSNGKVYMRGDINDGSNNYTYGYNKFCYWVDGTRTDLVVPDEAAYLFYPSYFTVSGGKVYVYGDSCDTQANKGPLLVCYGAFYWVDGVRTDYDVYHIGSSGFGSRYFAVIDGKVHVAASLGDRDQGTSDFPLEPELAFYWIDGVKQELPDAENIRAISLVVE